MGEETAQKHSSLYAGTLAKGLKLLRAFDESHASLSLSELVQRTGLQKSAVQRLAHTLHVEGMLDRDSATRRFRPSHAWLELAYAYYWSDPLIARALPKLVELSQQIGETVNLAQMSGNHIIYALRLPSQRTHFAASIVGRRVPALCTASGRVMLSTWAEEDRWQAVETWEVHPYTHKTITDRDAINADIVECRRNGYALTRDQVILNEISLAAPITGPGGRSEAAVQVSVSGLSYDFDEVRARILPAVLDTANGILA
tara:strand:- start:1873 stop:2646 length:774 start_codon:yes stop_codon:yes gene_type:complete